MTDDQHRQAPLTDRVSLIESQIHTVSRLASDILSAQRSIQGALREMQVRGAASASAAGPKARDDPEAFGAWVLWLVQTYDLLLEWPQCWYRHAGLVEELRALHDFQRGLATALADDPRAGFAWHDALWRFRARGLTPVKCPLSGHAEPTEPMVADRNQQVGLLRKRYSETLLSETSGRPAPMVSGVEGSGQPRQISKPLAERTGGVE